MRRARVLLKGVAVMGVMTLSLVRPVEAVHLPVPDPECTVVSPISGCDDLGLVLQWFFSFGPSPKFAIVGPCVANVKTEVGYAFHPIEPANPPIPEKPEKDELGIIGQSGVFSVFKRDDKSGIFNLEKFRWEDRFDIPSGRFTTYAPDGNSSTPSADIASIQFLTPGLYKITYTWRRVAPGQQPIPSTGDIFTAEKLVNVVDAATETVRPRETEAPEEKELTFNFVDLSFEQHLTKVAYVVERLAGSGGHDVSRHTPSPDDNNWVIMEGDEINPITHPTGSVEGSLVVTRGNENKKTYKAGLFGGRERVRMIGVPADFTAAAIQKDLRDALQARAGEVCQLGSIEIAVEVPGLVRFTPKTAATGRRTITYKEKIPGGRMTPFGPPPTRTVTKTLNITTPFWDLISDPIGKHIENDGTKLAAKLLFRNFATMYGVTAIVDGSSYSTLKIHRISTRSGGLYDIEGDWKKGHARHDIGVEYDVDASGLTADDEDFMEQARHALGDFWMPKETVGSGEVWHVQF